MIILSTLDPISLPASPHDFIYPSFRSTVNEPCTSDPLLSYPSSLYKEFHVVSSESIVCKHLWTWQKIYSWKVKLSEKLKHQNLNDAEMLSNLFWAAVSHYMFFPLRLIYYSKKRKRHWDPDDQYIYMCVDIWSFRVLMLLDLLFIWTQGCSQNYYECRPSKEVCLSSLGLSSPVKGWKLKLCSLN